MADFEAVVQRRTRGNKMAGDILDIQPAGFDWGKVSREHIIIPIEGISEDTASLLKLPQYDDGLDYTFSPDSKEAVEGKNRVLVSKRLHRIPLDEAVFKLKFPTIDFDKVDALDKEQQFLDQNVKIDPVNEDVIKDKHTDTYKRLPADSVIITPR